MILEMTYSFTRDLELEVSTDIENALRMAGLIAPRVTVLRRETLQLCTQIARISDQEIARSYTYTLPLNNLLKKVRPLSTHQTETLGETLDHCGSIDDLYHWWTLYGRHSPLSQTLLRVINKACPNVNIECKTRSTILHLLLSKCVEEHDASSCPLRYFLLFVRLGADPRIKYDGMTVLQLALALKRHPKLMSRRFFKRSTGHPYDVNAVVELLESYEKHGSWPDLSTTRSSLNTIRADRGWCVAESYR